MPYWRSLHGLSVSAPAEYTLNLRCALIMACCDRGSWLKREGRPKEGEVLTSRLIDRPLRPMFAPGWSNDTQVSCTSYLPIKCRDIDAEVLVCNPCRWVVCSCCTDRRDIGFRFISSCIVPRHIKSGRLLLCALELLTVNGQLSPGAFCAQVLIWVLSYDGVNSPEPLAITAAAAALSISGTKALSVGSTHCCLEHDSQVISVQN